jgi:hypothetical protein
MNAPASFSTYSPPGKPHIVTHSEYEQGSEQWLQARRGLLTASEMKLILSVQGGGLVAEYRATGALPEKLTPKKAQALAAIGERSGSVAQLAFLADVSDGVIRGLIKDGAIEKFETQEPLRFSVPNDDRATGHLYELLAQRVTGYVEPHFQTFDMERGNFDEEHARAKYAELYGEVEEVGFITNNKLGFPIGYSPDGLVGEPGQIEIKSRVQKWQMQTFIESVATRSVPPEFLVQCQTGLFVTEREWIDFISYSGGMKMATVRCYPDPVIQEAIGNAAIEFERRLSEKLKIYEDLLASDARLADTERLIYL